MKIKNILNGIYILTFVLLLVDVYNSNQTVYKYLHVGSSDIAILSLIIMSIARLFYKQTLRKELGKINSYFLFSLSFLSGVSLTIYDYVKPVNYVFATTHIQYTQLCLISFYTGIVLLLQKSDNWFKKYYRQIIFIGAFISFLSAFVISLFPFGVFEEMSKEDHFIENIQVKVLLIGLFFNMCSSWQFYKRNEKINVILFELLFFILFFIAGEEISWGQRIFHIATPSILSSNIQNEMTIHNIPILDNKVNLGYILIGFYGAFAWLLQVFIPKLKKLPWLYYIPPWYAIPYFFLGFLYNFSIRLDPFHKIGVWGEFMELMLYLGIMFTMFFVYNRLRFSK